MKKIYHSLTMLIALSSCAIGANHKQRAAYNIYKEKKILVESRDPNKAVKMGFLPGGSSFYNGDYDVAVFNILLWPVSILWEAGNASDRAILLNLEESEELIKKTFKLELSRIEEEKNLELIDEDTYKIKFLELYSKYNNPNSNLLSPYKSSNLGLFNSIGAGKMSSDNSYLPSIEAKITKTCQLEHQAIKKELKDIEKNTFLHNCSIEKRKKFIALGL
jgi:hypothetical protein